MSIITDKLEVGEKLVIQADTITHVDIVQPIIQVNAVLNQIEMPQKMKLKELEIESAGVRSLGRGRFKGEDVEVEDANRGLILTSLNGGKWLLWTDNNGSVFTTQIAASPEISYNERVLKIKEQEYALKVLKAEAALLTKDDIQGRLDNIEKRLGVLLK